jgi:DNA adenine methylase
VLRICLRGKGVGVKPFVKWAGGKRWLLDRPDFAIPEYSGRYIEPFLGGGAVFFHLRPMSALLADINSRLVETYKAIVDDPIGVRDELRRHHELHSLTYYYQERARKRRSPKGRAGQFLYLNRTCWNGLYRENLRGEFNVPIGTKLDVYDPEENFKEFSEALAGAEIYCQDFEETLLQAGSGDFVFIDPPYTTAHNINGFVKYNQKIFKWDDQMRLRDAAIAAKRRGAHVYMTNADHSSVVSLYAGVGEIIRLERSSVISGGTKGRRVTAELLIRL